MQARLTVQPIAQDVLGAGIDFDPSTNPIVRVQAGRLRKLLAEYYRRSGKDDNVLVYITKGQYAPQFSVRNTAIETKQTQNIFPQNSCQIFYCFVGQPYCSHFNILQYEFKIEKLSTTKNSRANC